MRHAAWVWAEVNTTSQSHARHYDLEADKLMQQYNDCDFIRALTFPLQRSLYTGLGSNAKFQEQVGSDQWKFPVAFNLGVCKLLFLPDYILLRGNMQIERAEVFDWNENLQTLGQDGPAQCPDNMTSWSSASGASPMSLFVIFKTSNTLPSSFYQAYKAVLLLCSFNFC